MGSLAVGPVVPGSQIPLDLDKELVPICNLVGVPMALIVRPNAPFKTIPELVAYAKANPGKVSYGSTGAGSTNQLGAELFAAEAGGLKLLHVPYRGGAPAIADVAAGQIDIFFANISEIVGQITSGQVRALALASTEPNPDGARAAAADQGHPDARDQQLVRPGRPGRPAGRTSRRASAKLFLEAITDPATKPIARLARPRGDSAGRPDAFQAQILKDRERWAKVVEAGNIRADKN